MHIRSTQARPFYGTCSWTYLLGLVVSIKGRGKIGISFSYYRSCQLLAISLYAWGILQLQGYWEHSSLESAVNSHIVTHLL